LPSGRSAQKAPRWDPETNGIAEIVQVAVVLFEVDTHRGVVENRAAGLEELLYLLCRNP
jgi:hypothetical protein